MQALTYYEYINNIIETRGRHGCGDVYHETHHITPRSLGGNNDTENLVDLFPKEHYEAHRLLALENPDSKPLVFAWHMMSIMNDVHGRQYSLTADEYEEARIAYVNMLKKSSIGENNAFYGKRHSEISKMKMSQSSIGKRHTDESKKKMSESRTGDKNHFYGKTHTDESKQKMSVSSSGEKNKRSRQVYCYELNEVFGSTREAERKTGICYRSIVDCANKKQKYAGKHPITGEKLMWEYIDNIKIKNDIG